MFEVKDDVLAPKLLHDGVNLSEKAMEVVSLTRDDDSILGSLDSATHQQLPEA